jgi:hypothetical protein
MLLEEIPRLINPFSSSYNKINKDPNLSQFYI